MKPTTLSLLIASTTMLCSTPALAVIDGDITGDGYGSPLAVQTIQTGFGDNLSELNAGYAKIAGGNLDLALTGNIENNFNKIVIFIDSIPGGQNVINPLNNPSNFDSQLGGGTSNGWESPLGSTTFDNGFTADFAMIARRGFGKFDFDFAKMDQTATPADELSDVFLGFEEGASGPIAGTNGTFEVGYNNANTLGVAAGEGLADTAAAEAVTTGLELRIPLAAIGNPAGNIKVTAWVSSGNLDFNSNQFLSPLETEDFDADPLTDDTRPNVGNFFGIDQLPGLQFFEIPNGQELLLGDLNGDGAFTNGDIAPFVLALTDPAGFASAFPDVDPDIVGDFNDDEALTNGDIVGFVAGLTNGSTSVPEPASLVVFGLGGLVLAGRRR